MAKNFLSLKANYNDFLSIPSPSIDKCLLENNSRVLGKLYGFLQKPESLLVLTGFKGTGKTQLVNHLLNYLGEDVELFKFYCSKSTTLDDLLMSLWMDFISVSANFGAKYEYSMSFQDKVSAYLVNSGINIVISLYDYDLLTEQNHRDILNFLLQITQNKNIKIILTSKSFDTTEIPEPVSYTKIIVKALSRTLFEKYLNISGIKATSRMFDELYKVTRGYFLYTQISEEILNLKVLSVSNYLVAYTNSGMSFDSFLAKAYISMLPENEQRILSLLAVVRHFLSVKVLEYLDFNDKKSLNLLKERGFVKIIDEKIYLSEYFRETVLSDSESELISDIRTKIINFYEEQLKYKPSERLILLSRNTMRSEVEYHKTFFDTQKTIESISEVKVDDSKPVEVFLTEAETLLNEYNYQDALKIYLQLLERPNIDKMYLYDRLALIYERVGNTKYAMYYLNILIKNFVDQGNIEEVNKYKLAIARIHYQMYKTNDAIFVLNEIISGSSNRNVVIDAYTLLANLYISIADKNKAYELYRRAIELNERENLGVNISELYFKFAILADEKGDSNIAVKNYRNCINSSNDDNKYKSLSYSNLGDFYLDMGDNDMALINFESAYKLDLENSNDYGVYYSASSIAKLLLKKDMSSAYQYLLKAREAALRSKDIFAIANAGLHLGDYFSNNNLPESALNEYFSVLNLVKDKFSNENKNKIFVRINDIKQKLGEDRFNELSGNITI